MPGGGGTGPVLARRTSQNAKLPPPPMPESQLDVLLRPGLLADVEIILEKIPNAINIPNQAVFEKDGKQIVYVRDPKGWEERVIKPMKRSESVMVIAERRQAGRYIAMSDPFAKPGDKKKKDKPASGKPGMPVAGWRPFMSAVCRNWFRTQDGALQPLRPQASQLADDAGHDFRCRRGGRDVVHHGGRAEGDDELHRSSGCEQYHHRSAKKRWTAMNCRLAAPSLPG